MLCVVHICVWLSFNSSSKVGVHGLDGEVLKISIFCGGDVSSFFVDSLFLQFYHVVGHTG